MTKTPKCFGCGVKPAKWPKMRPEFCAQSCAAFTASCLAGEFDFCAEHMEWWDRASFSKCPRCIKPLKKHRESMYHEYTNKMCDEVYRFKDELKRLEKYLNEYGEEEDDDDC